MGMGAGSGQPETVLQRGMLRRGSWQAAKRLRGRKISKGSLKTTGISA
jgi:hypothetical protein